MTAPQGMSEAEFQRERKFAMSIFTAAASDDTSKLRSLAAELANDPNHAHRTLALTDYKDGDGNTPLHHAAQAGNLSAAKCLLDLLSSDAERQIATVNAASKDGTTPLMAAASRSQTGMVDLLLSRGAAVSTAREAGRARAVHLAAMCGDAALVKSICAAAVDSTAEANAPSDVGMPLHWAAGSRHPDTVKQLLACGAQPDMPNDDGVCPIVMAAASGDAATISVLLQDGMCDPAVTSPDGTTALFACAANGHTEAALVVIKAAPTLFWKVGCDGLLPVQVAAYNAHEHTVKAMIDALVTGESTTPPNDFTAPQGVVDAKDLLDSERLMSAMYERRQADKLEVQHLVQSESDRAVECKNRGNELTAAKKFREAIAEYTEGIEHCERASTAVERLAHIVGGSAVDTSLTKELNTNVFAPLLCNRCACNIKTGELDAAVNDARRGSQVAPKWSKTHFRLAQAFSAQNNHADAAQAYWDAHQNTPKSDPSRETLMKLFKKAVALGKRQHASNTTAAAAASDTAAAATAAAVPPGAPATTYDHDVPVEIPSHKEPLRLRFNKGETPAEVAGRFVAEHALDPSLVPRIAHHVHTTMNE